SAGTAGTIPPERGQGWQEALSSLRADAPAMEPELAAEVVRTELGKPPEELFAFFSPRPIAAASIGQVHAAELADGTELAVKVQYPGVADAIRADLANTDALAIVVKAALNLLPGFIPNFDPKVFVQEIADRVVEELDYVIEAANQGEFADIYRDHPFIHVPDVFPELSSARVLTMEMVDGRIWEAALGSPQAPRLLDGYRLPLAPVIAPQPYRYSKRYAADLVAAYYDPAGPWSDVTRRFSTPKDFVFLNRIIVGLESVLGMLEASADWRAV